MPKNADLDHIEVGAELPAWWCLGLISHRNVLASLQLVARPLLLGSRVSPAQPAAGSSKYGLHGIASHSQLYLQILGCCCFGLPFAAICLALSHWMPSSCSSKQAAAPMLSKRPLLSLKSALHIRCPVLQAKYGAGVLILNIPKKKQEPTGKRIELQ